MLTTCGTRSCGPKLKAVCQSSASRASIYRIRILTVDWLQCGRGSSLKLNAHGDGTDQHSIATLVIPCLSELSALATRANTQCSCWLSALQIIGRMSAGIVVDLFSVELTHPEPGPQRQGCGSACPCCRGICSSGTPRAILSAQSNACSGRPSSTYPCPKRVSQRTSDEVSPFVSDTLMALSEIYDCGVRVAFRSTATRRLQLACHSSCSTSHSRTHP